MKSKHALTGILLLTIFIGISSHGQQQQNPVSKALTKSIVEAISGPSIVDLKPAAEKGDKIAQYKLGTAYYNSGKHAEGVSWFLKAAKQGHADAQFSYGNALVNGYTRDVPKDLKEGVRWLSMAAHQNHPSAQLFLSRHLEKGTISAPNKVEAMKWLLILVKDHPHNRVYVDNLALKMTTEEVAQAKQRAAAFRPSAAQVVKPVFKLQGISGAGDKKLAMINGRTFGIGEKGTVKLDGDTIEIHCVEIGTDYVTIKVKGESIAHVLTL